VKSPNFILGTGLVLLGILLLFQNFGYIEINFADLWPFLVILGGIGFWIGFLGNRKNYGLLMPGTILTIYGIMFLYCEVEGWYMMQYIWPFFLLGPGFGFYFMYLLGNRDKDLLIPGTILTLLGLFFFMGRTGYFRYWPILIIIIGIILLIRHQSSKPKNEDL